MTLLVHVATVPDSLVFLAGQPPFMRARGIETAVITSPGAALDEFGRREGVRTFGVPMARAITPAADATALHALVRILRSLRPDIVHAHTPKGGLLGTTAAFLARVPTRLYHMRGLRFAAMPPGPRRSLLVAAERTSCALATQVLCVSHSLREVAVAERLASATKLSVPGAGSGQGVDARGRFDPTVVRTSVRAAVRAELGIDDDALVIGFVGRLVNDKGVSELAAAWRALSADLPHARLVVVGAFEAEDPVDPAVRVSLERDARVSLVGFRRDTERYYAAFDLVVLPTYREGFPNVPLEAASMGLPVVATRIPGCIDAVAEGETGTLVPSRDPLALERAIRSYADDAALRSAHGSAGRARVLRDFDRVAVWSRIHDVYRNAMGAATHPAESASGASTATHAPASSETGRLHEP
jgi:glycosyltransferase involved in cell wall biosynthesis